MRHAGFVAERRFSVRKLANPGWRDGVLSHEIGHAVPGSTHTAAYHSALERELDRMRKLLAPRGVGGETV